MAADAKGRAEDPLGRVIQESSAGPFARPPVTRSEADAFPGTCASEGGLSGPALVFFILVATLATACAGGIQTIVHPPLQPIEITTAFVYPFGFRWEEPVYRRFELSQRLIDTAIRRGGDRLAFFGPSEFKVMRANDDGAWVATTALPLLLGLAQKPEQGVVIRPWAEKQSNSSVHEVVDKKGRSSAATMEETTYLGHVEVVHPSTGQLLIEVTGEVKVDPFSSDSSGEDEFDPARPLTLLMAKLTHEAIDALLKYSPPRPVAAELGLTVALTPKATMTYAEEGKPSAEVENAKLDPIAAELFVQGRARYLAPFLSDAEVPKVVRLPVGLYVAAAADGAKVEPGDLILEIDGKPALPERLARLRLAAVPAQVRVRKASGEETEVLLP